MTDDSEEEIVEKYQQLSSAHNEAMTFIRHIVTNDAARELLSLGAQRTTIFQIAASSLIFGYLATRADNVAYKMLLDALVGEEWEGTDSVIRAQMDIEQTFARLREAARGEKN